MSAGEGLAGFRLVLDMSLAHLRRRRRQTLVSVLGIMLGVGVFIAISSMMQGFHRDFIARIIDVSPHITMKDEYRVPPLQPAQRLYPQALVGIVGLRPRQELRGIRDPGKRVDAINRMPGVRAAPSLLGQVIARYGSTDVSGTIVGIEPELERRVSNLEKDLVEGTLTSLETVANGIILGTGLARKLGVKMNDTLNLVSSAGVVLRVKVVGLVRTGITNIDNFYSYALLKKVQILEQRPNVINRINMRLDDITKATALAKRIELLHGYRTESWEEANEEVLGLFVIQNGIIYSTVGAILIVSGFGIFNIVSTIIHEKSRDIAILMSMGFKGADMRNIFVLEGLALGAAGAVLGWALGYGLVELLGSVKFQMDIIVRTEGFVLYRWIGHYLIAGALAVVTSSLAAWLPARHAASLDPVEILRGGP